MSPADGASTPEDVRRRLQRVVRKVLASAEGPQDWTRQDEEDIARLSDFLEDFRRLGDEAARRVRARNADARAVQDAADLAKALSLGQFLGLPDDLAADLAGLFCEDLGIRPDLELRTWEEADPDPVFGEVLEAMAEAADEARARAVERAKAPRGTRRTKAS